MRTNSPCANINDKINEATNEANCSAIERRLSIGLILGDGHC